MKYSSRNYGVEIEFHGVHRGALRRKLEKAGLEFGECDSDYSKWNLKYDGSIDSTHGYDYRNELVTPIVKNEKIEKELLLALSIIKEMGGKINKSCGLHVHMCTKDLKLADLVSIVRRYNRFEKCIDKFMPRSRRGSRNTFCRKMDSVVKHLNNQIDYIKKNNMVKNYGPASNRYHKVNILPYTNHKTLEFRHHSGTLNFSKITNWVMFLDSFMSETLKMTKSMDGVDKVKCLKDAVKDAPKKQRALVDDLIENKMELPLDKVMEKFKWSKVTARANISILKNKYNVNVFNKKEYTTEGWGYYIYLMGADTDNLPGDKLFNGVSDDVKEFLEVRAKTFSIVADGQTQ